MAGYEIAIDLDAAYREQGTVTMGDIMAAAEEQLQDRAALGELYETSCPP